jgi:hypothetical protein
MSDVVITSIAERPEYAARFHQLNEPWPIFMMQDMVADALLWQVLPAFPELQLIATEADGQPVARGRSIPFRLASRSPTGQLPMSGWDQVLAWGMRDHADGEPPDTVSALEIAVDRRHLGRGLSARMLAALREAVAKAGFRDLVAPVRPNQKHRYPRMPMAEYTATTRDDGLPLDPWLRVHVRAGGVIDEIAPTSMLVAGSLAEWREWTGLPFAVTGPVEVPEALVPVHCDVEQDYAVYVEPNVWVRHRL